jgi:hypothetical protein
MLVLLMFACGEERDLGGPRKTPPSKPPSGVPARVTYDHILISFSGSYEKVKSFRSKDEARDLAYRLLERIRSGGDFEALKQEYSDDRDPKSGVALGPYVTVNDGVKRQRLDEIPRRNFHPLLRFLLFRLKVHEVAMADWHAEDCPDGWHIVKRLD